MSGCTTGVLICYFIVAQPPHERDDPFMLVFALFFCIFLGSTSVLTARSIPTWAALCVDPNLHV